MDSVEMTETLGRVRQKLERLRSLDKSKWPFGANAHGYRLGRTLTEAELLEKESGFGVSLPSQYRRFLKEIGHGGAGPCYGIFTLDSDDPEFINQFGGDLERTFPWTSAFNPDEWKRGDVEGLDGVEWDEDGRFVGMFLPGALYLCHCGCAIRNFLIVCGPCEGEVWCDNQANRKGVFPEVDEQGHRIGFLDWYELWLDKTLREVE